MSEVIYLNNAATTWPKPECVYEATDRALRAFGSPKRHSSAMSEDEPDQLEESRGAIARLIGAPDPKRLILQPGCTYALNLGIQGHDWRAGDCVVMSSLEHHAVSRPVRKLAAERGVEFVTVPYAPGAPFDLAFYEQTLKSKRVRLVACMMASNVTGEILPSAEIVRLAHEHGALCLLDGAQAVGIKPIDVAALGVDMLAIAGHKGLFGPTGAGALWVAEHVTLRTLAEGGTGGDSGKHGLPGHVPADYEVGTQNLPAIAGAGAGASWLLEQGVERVNANEHALVERLIGGLSEIRGVTIYGGRDVSQRTAAVSINVDGVAPKRVSAALSDREGIVCRAGFHCAPMAHETIGSHPHGGTVRFSPGPFSTAAEIDAAIEGVARLAREG
ncbi:MAG: aminotransferase class V-fold PLP-dependent enzyme [Phycisphaerales bacterium JB059]